ncbi:hypothetical protein N7475_000068 [Penicillium sp. IBT 31633x]|nr:hypothetical protein N7475_000068 [Penicillium sp. IBT 31633x]
MREVGIEKVLYYRTKELDSYYKGYPKLSGISLMGTIKNWETRYRLLAGQLETRLFRLGKGDLARVSDQDIPSIGRLSSPGAVASFAAFSDRSISSPVIKCHLSYDFGKAGGLGSGVFIAGKKASRKVFALSSFCTSSSEPKTYKI